jgi:MFS family permease
VLSKKSSPQQPVGRNYKWIALSNTTLAVFMSALNGSSLMIALPAIFRGIRLNPLEAGSSAYLLWILLGYMLVLAVLVVTLGRVGDMFGRVRIYNLGFVVFSVGSILLSLTWSTGAAGATELIAFRVVQAVGGACLMANSAAILTDAFPYNQRGLALGTNQVAFIGGSFVGIVAGGLLAEVGWRWVFLASVPIAVAGTIWSYVALREVGIHKATRIDWVGNLTFAAGLTMVLVGIVSGINPSPTSSMSWTTPFVLSMLIGGALVLVLFVFVEQRVKEPMFRLSLFRVRAFAAGNVAGLLSAIGRGGLLFMLSIWLQGIWLPLHGYSFEVTPFWAGIHMLPQATGFLIAGPLSGRLSDRFGARPFSTGGMVLAAITFALLMLLPVDFPYPAFALLLLLNGIASGLFISPNTASIMNSVPAENRGVASGMRAAFVNVGNPLSISVFFSLMIVGLNSTVPQALYNGLTQLGISPSVAEGLSKLPPGGYLFAALLGYNPLGTLLGPKVLSSLPVAAADKLTSRSYFPQLISAPFHHGLAVVFTFSIVICLIAAVASSLRGGKSVYAENEDEQEIQQVEPTYLPLGGTGTK